MFSRKMLLVVMVVFLMVNVVACSSSSSPQTESGNSKAGESVTSPEEKNVEIRVAWFGNQSRHDLLNQISDNFEKKYPNIKVTREFAATGDYWRKLTTQIAGKNAPDVFVSQYDRFEDFVNRGQLLALDDLVESNVLDLSDFAQAHINNGKIGDKLYGVSLGGSIRGMFFNTKMFADAGIEIPGESWTWDDFEKICEGIKAKFTDPNVYVIEDFTVSTDALQAYIRGKGYDYFKDGKIGFPKSELKAWFELGERFREKGYIPSPEIQTELGGKSQPESMFAKKLVAMQWKPTNQFPLYQEVMEDKLEVQVFPGHPGGESGSFIGSTNWVMPAYTKHPEAAAKFISYFSNDTEAVDLWKIELGPLPNKKMAEYLMPKLDEPNKRVVQFTDEMLPKLRPIAGLPDGGSEALNSIVAITEKVAYKKITIDDAVEEYFATAEKMLKN